MEKLQTAPKRDAGLDLVRAGAIVMVVFIHASASTLSSLPPGQGGWWWALVWSGPARMAVPLFFMCSGALFLSRPVEPRRLLTHNLPRILCAMFFWAFLYRLDDLRLAGLLTPARVWEAVKKTLLFQHEFHLYYLHILLVVYALLPALGVFLRSAARREEEYLLGVWFVLGILCPVLPNFWPFSLVSAIWSWWSMKLSFSCVGYVLLGHYLKTYGLSIPRTWFRLCLGLGAAIVVAGTAWFSLRDGKLCETFLSGNNPGAFLMAFGFFGLCLSRKEYPRPLVLLTGRLARASFCVYLCHILFLHGLVNHGFNSTLLPVPVFIPLAVLLTLLCGYLVWEVLHRIPVVKSYLV